MNQLTAGFAVRLLFMYKFAVLLFVFCVATNAFAQKLLLVGARQMILVTTPDWNAVQGTLQRFERKDSNGKWQKVGGKFSIVLGKSGLAWGAGLHVPSVFQPNQPVKREADRTSKIHDDPGEVVSRGDEE